MTKPTWLEKMGRIAIRAERPSDYSRITQIHYEAFSNWEPNHYKAETAMPNIARSNPLYDPELFPVAKQYGEVVGHAAYSKFQCVMLGQPGVGAFLGPIGVLPVHQKEGVGLHLLDHCRELLLEQELDFGILCGHPEYYPRFGYVEAMFALGGTKIQIDKKQINEHLEERPIREKDLKFVTDLWYRCHSGDALALYPGDTISCWISNSYKLFSSTLMVDGRQWGYVRYKHQGDHLEVIELLVAPDRLEEALCYLAEKAPEGIICLPWRKEVLEEKLQAPFAVLEETLAVNQAFMVMPLSELAKDYVKQIEEGSILPPRVAFPPLIDMDE